MFKGKAIISKLFALIVISVSIVIPFSGAKAQAQCTGMAEGQECTSGNYRITYTGIDEFGNRKFIVKEVNLGTDERYIESPFLTDYLAAAYRYSVIVTTVLATVVIIFAGVLWITSGGNVEKIGRAKKLIGRSVTGLVLAVGSYTILWTINPQLVEFGSLKILRVEQAHLEELPGKNPVTGKGVLVVIGGEPDSKYGESFMKTKIPQKIKDDYFVLYESWEIWKNVNKLKTDIKEAQNNSIKEGKGDIVYVTGFSSGGYAVFELLKTYRPNSVGLIDPDFRVVDNWQNVNFPPDTTMIWELSDNFIKYRIPNTSEYETVEKNIKRDGGKSIRMDDTLRHLDAPRVYFENYF